MRGWLVALVLLAARSAGALPLHLSELGPHGFTVVFETQTDVTATVEVARAKGEFSVAGTSKGRSHRIAVTGLSPLERVRYRVVVDKVVLISSSTRSGPTDRASALDFIVYGDTRDGIEAERACIQAARELSPVLAIHTGDVVPIGGDERWWPLVLENEAPLLDETPVYLALGNHELISDPGGVQARRFFPPPGGGPMYSTFRVGPVRFVMLDSNHLDAAQLAWLERVLGTSDAPHTFVFLHHPPFSMGDHCGSQQKELLDVLRRHRPSAVFAGHDHAYERLEQDGVRYFVTGGGGAPLYAENSYCNAADKAALELYRAEYHFLRVRVRGPNVELVVERPGTTPLETVRWRD